MNRLLLIGVDGATWDLIVPWIEEGKLPSFRSLMIAGVHGELESTIPPATIPAWNSLSTGKNPGKLGYFSWLTKKEGSYEFEPRFLYANDKAIWNIVSDGGKKVLIANVPNVHKATKVNGSMVAGFLHLSIEDLTYPKALKKELDDVTGGYEVDPIEAVLDVYQRNRAAGNPFADALFHMHTMRKQEYLKRINIVMNKRCKAFEFLLKEEWDFAFVVFVATDRTQHTCWANKQVPLACYQQIDTWLRKILDTVSGNTTVMIVSDHGFGPIKRVFYLNEWLLKEGYLKLKTEIPRIPKLIGLVKKTGISRLLRFLVGFLPSLFSFLLAHNAMFRVDLEKIDWKRTKAFASPVSSAGEIYLNVRGREKNGVISPERYEVVRKEILQKLTNLKDPQTAEMISAKVYRREDVYKGQHVNRAPDMIILQDDNINAFDTSIGNGEIFAEASGDVGHHRINGIFVASGPNIKKGTKINGAKICDIAPTILHILDFKVPEDMDGRVLNEIFEKGNGPETKRHESVAIEKKEEELAYHSENEKVILDRLRSLGYL